MKIQMTKDLKITPQIQKLIDKFGHSSEAEKYIIFEIYTIIAEEPTFFDGTKWKIFFNKK